MIKYWLMQCGEWLTLFFVVSGLFAFVCGGMFALTVYLFIVGAMVFIFGIMALAYECAENVNTID